MTLVTRRRSRSPASEEAAAAARVVLAMTLAVGGMAAAIGAAAGDPILAIALPTAALSLALIVHAVTLAGWAGLAVWLVLLPSTQGEAILAPLVMAVLCLAVAIGPDRLLAWIGRDAAGRPAGNPQPWDGWIEEDVDPVDRGG
jgi:hypothetical protein